jgi:hypothetical protein
VFEQRLESTFKIAKHFEAMLLSLVGLLTLPFRPKLVHLPWQMLARLAEFRPGIADFLLICQLNSFLV